MGGVLTLNDRSKGTADSTPRMWCGRSADRLGEQVGGRDQVRFAREGEAEEERGRGRSVRGAVAVQLVQADAGAPGPPRRLVLVRVLGEPGEQVQAGLGAADADLGQVLAELADQQVPLGAVAPAHGAQV